MFSDEASTTRDVSRIFLNKKRKDVVEENVRMEETISATQTQAAAARRESLQRVPLPPSTRDMVRRDGCGCRKRKKRTEESRAEQRSIE